jgi:hypothetical protein
VVQILTYSDDFCAPSPSRWGLLVPNYDGGDGCNDDGGDDDTLNYPLFFGAWEVTQNSVEFGTG